jgi:tetratricopeptide (TPR) repeat protein
LIREYFATQLRKEQLEAWRAAHLRIFEYLRDNTKHFPDTLAGLQPLYQAVAHACSAGHHDEAGQLYTDRILRGDMNYSTFVLGAIGADLGATANFFDKPWSRVSPLLSNNRHAWILNEAAFSLRSLGRLTEALEPMRAALQMVVAQKSWDNAAVAASNLSDMEISLGFLDAAVKDATQGVEYADLSKVPFHQLTKRARLADALHNMGNFGEALRLFGEAEVIQATNTPANPMLHSLAGFLYTKLLLADVERAVWRIVMDLDRNARRDIEEPELLAACRNAEDRARASLVMSEQNGWLDDIALDHLTICRATFYSAILLKALTPPSNSTSITDFWTIASQEVKIAVDGFHRAGTVDGLIGGLLTRSLIRVRDYVADARVDLDEAWLIAERGPMRLQMADIHLYRARLFHAVKPYPWESPHADLAAARELIKHCAYWRRKEELEDAEAAAQNW